LKVGKIELYFSVSFGKLLKNEKRKLAEKDFGHVFVFGNLCFGFTAEKRNCIF
jgi:hypothetical protein